MTEPENQKIGRPTRQGQERGTAVALRGSQEWKDWLNGFAAHCRLGLADTIEQSLIRYAKQRGFEKPPKR